MKKFLDKNVVQSYGGQVAALAVAFVLMVLLGAFIGLWVLDETDENTAKFGNRATWGLMQCVDGGFVDATITSNTKMEDGRIVENAPMSVVAVSIGFWLFGLILVSFFTGAATDFLASRREKILGGEIDYAFKENYVLVVGYDFQVKNLIRVLLAKYFGKAIVLMTDSPVEDIYADILPELSRRDARRLYVMRKDISLPESYSRVRISKAEEIFIIGDGGAIGRDGKVLQALEEITKKGNCEHPGDGHVAVKTHVHIEDSILYSQVRAMELPSDGGGVIDLEVYNYYESWAWKCWSDKDSTDGIDAYRPLRFRKGTRHAELFVIGAGRMGCAMVNFAMPLMNYGEDGKHCRITIFDADPIKKGFLPDRDTLQRLPEVEVRYLTTDGCSDEANDIMLQAAQKEDVSVTVVIAISDPGKALRAYAELSNRLRRCEVSVLVWQATHSKNCPDKKYLRMGGVDSVADKTKVCYFGMTDVLPWQESSRSDYGMVVNFFYNSWYPYGQEAVVSPAATSGEFIDAAKSMWNEVIQDGALKRWPGREKACKMWAKTKRWKRWSSVNSGDTFREKSVLFADLPYAVAAEMTIKAEHNRWWTEKLLSGWISTETVSEGDESHADKAHMIHGDMVPFAQLSEDVKDKDKVNIAAMAAFNFI